MSTPTESMCDGTVFLKSLPAVFWGVVIGFGVFFVLNHCIITSSLNRMEKRTLSMEHKMYRILNAQLGGGERVHTVQSI